MVVAINVVAASGIAKIADMERPASLTVRSHRIMGMVFMVQLTNLGFLAAFVHLDLDVHIFGEGIFGLIGNGIFTDLVSEWYVVVGSSVLLTTCLQTVCPLLGILTSWLQVARRWCCACRWRARSTLVDLYTPPHFELAMQHAQQLCILFVAFMFS
eukprot:CAMPEP_0115742516 /NCGR_PEP_ID=MMETSP0272-20121206/90569_1 /TAXON_ID=71861 /ORGANISM="Scrippsiella trochoidea, Strain CCMP3099" /LENGTH=155 /DNA_ID=CAMNT_0003187243 /DNA_START=1 /DNA_END=464 /DNA_ORIENTATION=+